MFHAQSAAFGARLDCGLYKRFQFLIDQPGFQRHQGTGIRIKEIVLTDQAEAGLRRCPAKGGNPKFSLGNGIKSEIFQACFKFNAVQVTRRQGIRTGVKKIALSDQAFQSVGNDVFAVISHTDDNRLRPRV